MLRSYVDPCSALTLDADGALFRFLPGGGSLALAPTHVVGNFQASEGAPAATSPGSAFALTPPPIAHFVGATPYKVEFMQVWMGVHRVACVRLSCLHGLTRSPACVPESRPLACGTTPPTRQPCPSAS